MPGLASAIGRAIRPLRHDLGAASTASLGEPTMTLRSVAFADGAAMAARFTADGAGLSPPLQWSGIPSGTATLALLVEDVDVPFPRPLVHLVLHGMSPDLQGLAEGAVPVTMQRRRMFTAGRNSFGRRGWLPPSPISGHGPHRYVFQIIALADTTVPIVGRETLRRAMQGKVLGHGRLVGTYQRS